MSNFADNASVTRTKGELVCFYCKKPGHKISDCIALKKKEKGVKHVGLISTSDVKHTPARFNQQIERVDVTEMESVKNNADFAPFLTEGTVALPNSDETVPVRILRDTGAGQSFLMEGLLPLSERTATGTQVLVRGLEMGCTDVPLHRIHLNSKLVSGDVVVGVRAMLPVPGVTFILGNDLAGGNVWEKSDGGVPPIVVSAVEKLGGSSDCLDLYPACAITRAMAEKSVPDETENILCNTFLVSENFSQPEPSIACTDVEDMMPVHESHAVDDHKTDKSDSMSESPFICDEHVKVCSLSPLYSVTRDDLIKAQQADDTVQKLFSLAHEVGDKTSSPFYFLQDGLLYRQQPMSSDFSLDPRIQIVVPLKFRKDLLQLSHQGMAGHMGVRKTYDRVLRKFYWPRCKRDVINCIRSCHTCQMTGKPNQKVPVAPLQPIAAVTTPFSHLTIDCVGPLPRSKAGHAYLLTVMCQTTRYPAAFPLRSITSKAILKALTSFMSIFGIPKTIQSDQGSNFMSRNFSKVMRQLEVKHNISSAYHPQSQGGLERFHQTLKSLLRSYCVELDCDWEEGLPWMLLAIREVVQESIGFSPNELVFGHTVRGPIAVLADEWTNFDPPENVLDYVSSFRYRLYETRAIALRKLAKSQGKMQRLFDRKVKSRHFQAGDQVLALLPVLTSPFQARFAGPYTIAKSLSNNNYLLNTPDRRKKIQVCHVNLLKSYVTPVPSLSVDVVKTAETADSSVSEASVEEDDHLEEVEGRLNNSEVLVNLAHHLSHLSELEKTDIIELVNSFPSLFSDVPTRTSVIEHDIDVGTAQPVKQHAYRVNPIKRKLLQKEVDYLLDHNLAEPSFSSWSSPCILVSKPDNSYRFCTDYRKLNCLTKPDCYPLPRIDDCVDRVGSAKFVSKFDLLKGYWQVPLTSRAKELSAFVTPDRFLQYTVMPFGVRNAPATFQRLVNHVLSGMSGCEAYLDDVVLYSSSWSEHLDQIRELFVRLAKANLTINLAKCEFGKATVTYLGKVVGRGCVKPIHAKVNVICSFPKPATRRELRRFLGMVGYYRGFCHNFASVVAPLTDLLSPKIPFQWSEKCQRSFENAKSLLANAPVLVTPNFEKRFLLAVDASAYGAGAVLLQEDCNGIEHPVSYFSKKFNRHQQVYSTVEKEALALILAVQHFEVYLSAVCGPITVYTDHNPLTFLDRMRGKNQRIMRWSLILQPFHLQIKHIRGKDNIIADALSRM